MANLIEPAEQIVLKNTQIGVNTFIAFRSYFETKSVFLLDLSLTGINDECLEFLA